MKIISFNVNGIRARLHQLMAVINKHKPDIIGVQEIKVTNEQFPQNEIEKLGYKYQIVHGQKSNYGVALFTKVPVDNYQVGFSDISINNQKIDQARVIFAELKYQNEKLKIINSYFPNGDNDGTEIVKETKRINKKQFTNSNLDEKALNKLNKDKENLVKRQQKITISYPYKKAFYQKLTNYIKNDDCKNLLIMGDFNIAPQDIDVGIEAKNYQAWIARGDCGFLPEEREWLQNLITSCGLVDIYRKLNLDSKQLSWFHYMRNSFAKHRGLRIDYFLTSSQFSKQVLLSGIDYEIRGMEKPSDHAPIWLELK